jgi:hypothetical protein
MGQLNAQNLLAVVAIPPTLWAAFKDELPRPASTPAPKAVLDGDFSLEPWQIVLVVIAAIQLLERTAGGLVGLAVGSALGSLGVTDEGISQFGVLAALWLVLPAMAIGMFPISVWAAHRAKSQPLLLIGLGAVLSGLISVAVASVVAGGILPIDAAAMAQSYTFYVAVLVPGALLGVWWARRTRYLFAMSRLFKQLHPTDQRDLYEMARIAGTPKLEAPASATPAVAPG